MDTFMLKPTVLAYDTCKEMAEALQIGEGDLMITNQYIYEPYFADLHLKCDVLFQEKYGAGEPSDEMAEAMYKDFAVGGGTIIDLSKFFSLKTTTPILDLYDGKIKPEKGRELVIVPTTCGTGSEVTNVAVLALISRDTKKGLAVDEL